MYKDILFFILLIGGSAFFSASETAFFSISSIEKKRLIRHKGFVNQIIVSFLNNATHTLVMILIGNMIINTSLSSLITVKVGNYFGYEWLGLALGIFTFLLLIFGEIVPKNIALSYHLLLAKLFALPLFLFSKLIYPLTVTLVFLMRNVFRVSIEDDESDMDHSFTDNELNLLIEKSAKEGILNEDEMTQISNILSFGQRKVKELMIPRTEIFAFDLTQGKEALDAVVFNTKVHNVVIYKEDLDHIVGTLNVKDYLLNRQESIKKLMREPVYVPVFKSLDEMAFLMKTKRIELAICVDEFGGTSGVISQDELIESVFGDMHVEEDEDPEDMWYKIKGDYYYIDGGFPLFEMNKLFMLREPIEDEHADTLSGFLLKLFGEIPEEGRAVQYKHLEFHVTSMEGNRIAEIKVKKTIHGAL